MAGAKGCLPFIVAFHLFVLPTVYLSEIVSFCWHGDIEAHGTLMNESCATGRLSLPNVVSRSSDFPTSTTKSPAPENLTVTQVPLSNVRNCLVFRYMVHSELGQNDKTFETSIYANYSCDHQGLCKGTRTGWHQDVTYRGLHGDVFCCNTDSCNIHVSGVPPQQQLCYNANNRTDTPTREVVSCMASGAVCARSTWNQDGRVMAEYFCDNSFRCLANGIKMQYRRCKQVKRPNSKLTEQLCCCDGNKCFIPPWSGEVVSTQKPAVGHMTNHWIIGGSIVSVTVCVGAAIAVLVAIVHRRRKTKGDNHVAMMYRRISADEAPAADDQQLIT